MPSEISQSGQLWGIAWVLEMCKAQLSEFLFHCMTIINMVLDTWLMVAENTALGLLYELAPGGGVIIEYLKC